MNWWPFKKRPALPKPRLMKFERSRFEEGDWRCGVGLRRYYGVRNVGMTCEKPMGIGKTPRAAYLDWKRQKEAA